jgi:hypothetical protein
MATGKPARGSTHGPGGPWPCGLVDTGKPAQGTTPSRVADTHGPSGARGNDAKDASLGERPAAIGSDRFREATGRCTASRVAPGHAPSSTRQSAGGLQRFPKKVAAFGALRYRHRREGRTRSPRCAARSARWASGSAVKGRPLSGEGRERQGQRPGYARQVGTPRACHQRRDRASREEPAPRGDRRRRTVTPRRQRFPFPATGTTCRP